LKNEYFLIDHSLNGTHIVAPAESLSSSTRVPSISRNDLPTREIDKANYHQDTAEIDAVIFGAPDTKAWDKFSDLNKSHAAFKVEQLSSRLPQVVGYSPHTLAQMGDLQPLLEMVYSSDDALHLTSMGRLLHSGSQIVIIGKEHHHLTYNA
jgi:hypothetical protein